MNQDPYKYFRIEARELLDQMGQGVLDLEKGGPTAEIVPRLLRHAHTLKGAARVVRQPEIAELAHIIEGVLAPFRDQPGLPRDSTEGLLKSLDEIQARVVRLDQPAGTSPAPAPAAKATTTTAVTANVTVAPAVDDPGRARWGGGQDMEALLDGITETNVQVASLGRAVTTVERVRHLAELATAALDAPRAQRTGDGLAPKVRATIDELRGLVVGLERQLLKGVEQVGRELRQVRETAERLRLAPAALMFVVLERTARDVAGSLGKRVAFQARGGDVRLDARVLGTVQNALVQTVRNAIAHGIERPGERAAAGKPEAGQVIIEVVQRGNRVSFLCRDDGRGFDLEAVRRAVESQGVAPGEARALDGDALIRLLLKGGISTARTVSEISGRGIGLDLVHEAAVRLGGEVAVRTDAGRGTTVEIVVPLSLSSMEALIVETGQQMAAIPLDAVLGTRRLAAAEVVRSADGASIVHEGQVIPFTPLGPALRATPGAPQASQAGRAWSAVVIGSGGTRAAIGVDRLLGVQEIVVRPLPGFTPADPVVLGASLDALGNPQLVLDPEQLMVEARQSRSAAPALAPRAPILVIDDSMTTRMLEQSILQSAGYDVEVAASAEEGYEKALAKRFGLILVDVEMPGMDGFTFVQRSRADPALREVPAILVTSRDSAEDRQRGLDAGAAAYVVKSEFDQADLLQRIRSLMG